MKKRIALLLVLALLMSNIVVATSAEATTVNRYCEACKANVDWQPLGMAQRTQSSLSAGHYYLAESITYNTQKAIMGKVCLDLNGQSLSSAQRSLLVSGSQYPGGPILNIFDSVGGGVVASSGGSNNAAGGTILTSGGGILNLYSGTLKYISTEKTITTAGGVVCANGKGSTLGSSTFNMYGGCVDASQCVLADDSGNKVGGSFDGCGAAVIGYSGATVNLAGGQVIAGKANAIGRGDCVYINDANTKMTLSGSAKVDEIYFQESSASNFQVSGTYTGEAQVAFGSNVTLASGTDIGNLVSNGDISGAKITCAKDGFFVTTKGTDLVLTDENPKASTTARCAYCENFVEWLPWGRGKASMADVTTGHYYLTENITNSKQKIIKGLVCIDLNGYTISSTGRALLVSASQYPDGPVLNIFDTDRFDPGHKREGAVITTGGSNNAVGGTVSISGKSVFNLYGGTLKHITTEKSIITAGGVVGVAGKGSVFNMYGGCVDASQCFLTDDKGSYSSSVLDGSGAAIMAGTGGSINLAGGSVIAGHANACGLGDCVFVNDSACLMTLGDDAQVDEIFFNFPSSEKFNISGKYTGSAKLTFVNSVVLEDGMDVGNLVRDGDISGAQLTCTEAGFFVNTRDNDLVLSYTNPNAEATVIEGSVVVNYDTWEEAFANAEGKLVQLNKSVADDISLEKDLYLDLNGNNITGALSIAEGKTLYCMDSKTDDYTIADGVYGKLTNVTGTVAGIALECDLVDDAYMMIEADGAKTFHRIGLQLTAMTLRPGAAGVYYKSDFGGDEMVRDLVASYGVALSAVGVPTAENLDRNCKYSEFTDFSAGGNDQEATSTLLYNIVNTQKSDAENSRRAQIPVYGRAYMKLKDGTYLFGEPADRSFKEQLEKVSDRWDTLEKSQKDAVYEMFTTYRSVMDQWDVMNLRAFKDPTQDDVLKIINISNSHGVDSTWLIPEVLKAERPDQKFVLVELYQSYALTEHVAAAQNNDAVYHYYINTGDGWTTITEQETIEHALQTYTWDIVMFNESSRHLGLEEYMSKGLIEWFKQYILSNLDYETKLLYNMTWANPTDEGFYTDGSRQAPPAGYKAKYTEDYGFDRVNHYNKLVELTKKYLVNDTDFAEIIYNATPVQYATNVLKVPEYDVNQVYDTYRDYTHLSDFARLIVAYNWYCQVFDVEAISEVKVDVIPWSMRAPWGYRHQKLGDLTLTQQHKDVLLESVNYGLQHPLEMPAAE